MFCMTYLWHVHVVNEVDECLCAGGTIVSASFLLERFLKDALQHHRRRVEVERHVGDHVGFGQTQKLVVHEYGLASTSGRHQHHWTVHLDEHVDEESHSRRLRRRHQCRLQRTQTHIKHTSDTHQTHIREETVSK